MFIGSHQPHRRRAPARALPRTVAASVVALLALVFLAACSGEAPLPGEPLRLVSASPPDPVLGEPYQEDLTPSGGLRPYTYTLAEGRLPPGLTLQGGTIIGTPTETGRYEFTVTVSDANLARTFQDYTLTVRELPVPTLSLAVPDTEVRDEVILRGRIEDVRALRGARVRVTWDDPALRLAEEGVRAPRDDVVALYEAREDGVAIDLAVLGEPIDGSPQLFQIVLIAEEATRIGVDVTAEILYSGRHVFVESRVGAPRTESDGSGEGAEDTEEVDESATDEDPESQVADDPEAATDVPAEDVPADADADEPDVPAPAEPADGEGAPDADDPDDGDDADEPADGAADGADQPASDSDAATEDDMTEPNDPSDEGGQTP